jgi:ABC-type Fe3+ transport system permease subunit
MRARLHFIVVTALVVACLVGLVVASSHYNWPPIAWVPGSHLFKPLATTLWDWLMAHLLIVLVVLLIGLVLARLTDRRGSGQGRRLKKARSRAEAARRFGHQHQERNILDAPSIFS